MAEGNFGKAARYLTHELAGHTIGARGFVEGGQNLARRTAGKGIETRAVRATFGSLLGAGLDVLAPATYKTITYTHGLRRAASILPALALDGVANATAIVASGATLHMAPLTIAPIKLGVNAAENAALDLLGKVTGTYNGK